MTDNIDPIATSYVRLSLALDQHIPGYIDAYFGPTAWRTAAVAAGPQPVLELAREAAELSAAIPEAQGMDPQRRDWLLRQVAAMRTSLRLLAGERLTLVEEVAGLYDITPTWTDESVFEEAHRTLAALLPGSGSLAERLAAKKHATEISVDQARRLLPDICAELRRRTRAHFPLPADESFDVEFVSGQPWGAYNWYLGNCRSRIDVNTDLPLQIVGLSGLLAHEGYAGHHTELSIKEDRLLHGLGWSEHCLALINSPSCTIAEALAVRALEVLMSDSELIAWHANEIFPQAGLGHLDAAREHAIVLARRRLAGVAVTAAFLLRDRAASQAEVIAYLERFGLRTEPEAHKLVSFLTAPLSSSYIFTYHAGGELLDALFAARGEPVRWFRRLLTEPVTPSQVRAWIQER